MPVSWTARHPTAGQRRDPYPSYPSRRARDSDVDAGFAPPTKRRKPSAATEDHDAGKRYRNALAGEAASTSAATPLPPSRGRDACPDSEATGSVEDEAFLSRDEIERSSPSRKDGIDRILEAHLRHSYCVYLKSLGMSLQLPQTTIGTAMVLCHRFFLHRSHACHDRFLIATAALFLASKSEETPCPLNTVTRVSCEIFQKLNFAFYPHLLYNQDWFEQYRERVIEAEQMILMTLDFELDVQHPYTPLASVLTKLGLSQTVLLTLAWNVISEGVFTKIMCSCVKFFAGH